MVTMLNYKGNDLLLRKYTFICFLQILITSLRSWVIHDCAFSVRHPLNKDDLKIKEILDDEYTNYIRGAQPVAREPVIYYYFRTENQRKNFAINESEFTFPNLLYQTNSRQKSSAALNYTIKERLGSMKKARKNNWKLWKEKHFGDKKSNSCKTTRSCYNTKNSIWYYRHTNYIT